ncbi:MAG: response regulator [Kofleriaceae bacterium]|nr:response regulator [Kofleriaceae bacterium]
MSSKRAARLERFRVIATDRVRAIEHAMLSLEQDPQDDGTIVKVMREIHTLKGESKLMRLETMNKVAHKTEDLLLLAKENHFRRDEVIANSIFESLGVLEKLINQHSEMESAASVAVAELFIAQTQELLDAQSDIEGERKEVVVAKSPPAEVLTNEPANVSDPNLSGRKEPRANSSLVRVSASRLVSLTNQSGELVLRHTEVSQIAEDLARLCQDWSTTLQSVEERLHAYGTNDEESIESILHDANGIPRLAALAKELRASVRALEDETFSTDICLQSIQNEIGAMRLLQVGSAFSAIPGSIRLMAKELGKEIRTTLIGEEVGIDKQVLDRLEEPLLHLIRNSVDHGIEQPATREAANKPRCGSIVLKASQAGAHVEIEIRDDGKGIDPAVVRETIVAKGLLSLSQAEMLTQEETMSYLFDSGFSTAKLVTDYSGRGLGLDVVQSQIRDLGGSVRIESEVGKGAAFIMRIPISIALAKVLVVQLTEGLYAVPAATVDSVVYLSSEKICSAGAGLAFEMPDGHKVPLFSLQQLLGFPEEREASSDFFGVVVVRHNDQRFGLRVGKIVGERQAVQQKTPEFLRGIKVLSGTTVIEGGKFVCFLNVPALADMTVRSTRKRASVSEEGAAARRKTVLVVEDSELTRDMIVASLNRLGFQTIEVADGQDAAIWLRGNIPDVVMTDLDMPVMDGYALMKQMRADSRLSSVPIVVCSTRDSAAEKARAADAGANAYLQKSSFDEEALLRVIESVLPSSENPR